MYQKAIFVFASIYFALLVYASLMPFDISLASFLNYDIWKSFEYWPFRMDARVSGSDVVSNLALYIPLGFFSVLYLLLKNISKTLAVIVTIIFCSLVSLGIEVLQVGITIRVASASDWLFNTISGAAGSLTGLAVGVKNWQKSVDWVKVNWIHQPVFIITGMFLMLLVLDALSPFLPTILLKQVWHNIKYSHFLLIPGYYEHAWHWWLVQRFMVYLVLSTLLAVCLNQDGKLWTPVIWACCIAAAVCIILEIMKLFIVSRSFNSANVLTGWLGCLAVLPAWRLFIFRATVKQKVNGLIVYLLLYIFYLAWFPFDFFWDISKIKQRIPSAERFLPFYDYAMGATLHHATLFIQSVFLLGLLVYLLRVRYALFNNPRTGVLFAAVFCTGLGIMQEGGQLMLGSRTPSITDIYCFALGGAVSAWIRRPFNHEVN